MEDYGAGEILLTSMDKDGTKSDDINRSVIQTQVEMGVAVRMAAMDLLARNLRETRMDNKGVMV